VAVDRWNRSRVEADSFSGTVDDFLKLDGALRSARLLPARFDSILGPAFSRQELVSYGGGGPGTNTQYAAWSDGLTIIVFSNRDPSAGTQVAQELAKALGRTIQAETASCAGRKDNRSPRPGPVEWRHVAVRRR
jgi:hypothetical protein